MCVCGGCVLGFTKTRGSDSLRHTTGGGGQGLRPGCSIFITHLLHIWMIPAQSLYSGIHTCCGSLYSGAQLLWLGFYMICGYVLLRV